ncbi:hypothetical protein [Spirosoma agri]|uniref:Uncharacterized protein n=1 Tax=Spirosoma agri TaxID=1987381 RepID=A0A6M0IHV0_9BACT|nr:hypothetical protein [Spirosoma agri]NEU67798.1 hypothetical protein [Spirosoma agri]
MLLLIVTMNDKGDFQPFSFQVSELESAFEVLNSIASSGDVLVNIDLMDNGQCFSLPAEAFDGEPIRPHVDELEKVWQALLNKPVNQLSINHQMLALYSERLRETYQLRIDWLELAIIDTNAHIQELPRGTNWESRCVRLELQLTKYRWQLEQAQAGQRRVCERLAPYMDCE